MVRNAQPVALKKKRRTALTARPRLVSLASEENDFFYLGQIQDFF